MIIPNFKTKQLNEVFGIQANVPKYTYLKRERYDEKIAYHIKTQKHIVIHGASKQGKSCLRKQTFSNKKTLIIQCLPTKSVDDLIIDIYRDLKIELPHSVSRTESIQAGSSASLKLKTSSGEGALSGNSSSKRESKNEYLAPQGYNYDFKKIKAALQERRLIFEDFHYLSEEARKRMAFYLKGFYEEEIFVIIIGIWSEQNLLTYYNGDLSGRVEELDLTWTEEELNEVLEKGERALRIKIDDGIKKEIIHSSFNNVGLTQRLAEKLCLNAKVQKSNPWYKPKPKIDDDMMIAKAINDVVVDIRQRYIKILDVFERGFEKSTLEVYFNIFKAITISDEKELVRGISQSDLLNKVRQFQPKIRVSDLTAALNRLERLQSTREITPFLLTYNEILREIHLVDREFLFYKTFGNPSWEWLE